ncbi:MAG: low specificity L-threonine aldolase [Actinobacteria bacterium]|nr:low specificity L-threonine aldolase [Actinomycetota bacterium]
MAFPDGTADFRSDTVSRPTAEMRAAMAAAEVGDDVYGEDPTVEALEREAAAAVGKEAALFVPSGTMGNQIAVHLQSRRGTEVVCNDWAHVRNHERAAASWLSGVAFRSVPGEGGVVAPEQVTAAAAQAGYHLPEVSLLVWENTHNVSGGAVVPREAMAAGTAAARAAGIPVHLDGARLFNAAAASGTAAEAFAAEADTVMFCLSKGLGAPVGSMLCGTGALVAEAREVRKRLGGGMRQSGVLAAAGRLALAGRARLAEDHAVAARLAAALEDRLPGAVAAAPETNMVLVEGSALPGGAEAFRAALAAEGVLVGYIRPGVLRFCTHHDVDGADAGRVAAVAARLG